MPQRLGGGQEVGLQLGWYSASDEYSELLGTL
jgi:hypothetical protein